VNLAVLRWSGHRTDEAGPHAAPHARRAIGLWDKLVEESPRDPYYRRWLAKSCVILCAVGADSTEGERLGQRAVELHEGLIKEFPGVPTHRYELATAWNWLARNRLKADRDADAMAAYRTALGLFDRLAIEFPDRPDYYSSAGNVLVNLANAARERGDPDWHRLWDDAKKRFRAALARDPAADRYHEKIRREFSSVEPPGRRSDDAGPSD
jgi:tetratricopeptide (TPR) repeat protein